MISKKLLIFSQNSINLTNKLLSKPNYIYIYLKNNDKVINFMIFTIILLLVEFYYAYLFFYSDNKILSAIISILILMLFIPTASTLILLLFPKFNTDIKIYKEQNQDGIYKLVELQSPLFKIKTKKDINYDNRPKIKQGPGNIGLKYIAIRYVLIQNFYKEERINGVKYSNQEDFLRKIETIEKLKTDSLKKHYSNFKKETNLNIVIKENIRIIKLLIENNEFINFPIVENYIKKQHFNIMN